MTTALDALIAQTRALLERAPALRPAFPDLGQLPVGRPDQRAVYVLGTIKSGKSTLINGLLGQDVMPRGAGVKTFNLCHARHGDSRQARVQFHSAAQLAERLTFDYRLLGHHTELPADLWAEGAVAALTATHQVFLDSCAADGRLQDAAEASGQDSLLARALARVTKTLAGLQELVAHFPAEQRRSIQAEHRLDYSGDTFDDHLDWTRSPDLAALIRAFELELPFPDGTPEHLELVDCQGSDSLNPLDFADVEAALQRADVILYVVQSRLGLRQADHDLLRHLAGAGAAERVVPVMNVEAFDPVQVLELEQLTQRCNADLLRCLGREVDVLPVNALHLLAEATGDTEELTLMQRLWERRDATFCLEVLVRNQALLRDELAGAHGSGDRQAGALRLQLRRAAEALLARDRAVLGVEDATVDREEAEVAVQRILQGEQSTLRRVMARETNSRFAPEAPLQQEIDQLLGQDPPRYAEQRPVPEGLHQTDLPAVVLDEAVATFNADWLDRCAAVRTRELRDLEDSFSTRLTAAMARIGRLLPQALPDAGGGELELLLGPAATANLLQDVAASHTPPRLFSPVVLPTAVRHALVAEFQGRRALKAVGQRLRKQAGNNSTGCSPQVATLWRRTLQACLKAAAEQRGHAIANACENYKHRYFQPLTGQVLETLEGRILAVVHAWYDQLARLAADDALLLDARQRGLLEDFLDAV